MTARSLIGPSLAGTAIWCALGIVTLESPEPLAARLVVPAPAAWWAVAIAVAWLVPAWRRNPWTTWPAVLTTLPWWPVPLPAGALVWTGKLAWVPIGSALALAVWSARRVAAPPPPRAEATTPFRGAMAAGALSVLAASVAAFALSERLPAGDEPHYLVITQSLLADGDLKIENNHAARAYAPYFPYDLPPDFLRRGTDGEIYSIHAPGTSVLVLPAFWLAGYRGAQATVIGLAGLCGALVWLIGWLATHEQRAAWFAWAAVSLSSTAVLQSVMIFPDGPGFAATALATLTLMRLTAPDRGVVSRGDRWFTVATGVALATLPWLHTRFVLLSCGFGLLILLALWRCPAASVRERLADLTRFLAVPVVSALGWFWFFQSIYGTPNPSAPYGPSPDTHLAFVPGGLLGLLFDQQFGLLTYAPALWAGVAALRPRATAGRPLWSAVFVGVAYLAASATYWMWYAGVPATPARFATAALAVFAAPVAVGWQRSSESGRVFWSGLLVVSLAFTGLLAWGTGGLAWNVRFAETQWIAWLGSVADLKRAWPSFFWALTPGDVGTEWPFLSHVAWWVALCAGVGLLAARFGRAKPVAAALTALLLMPMLAVHVGAWWHHGAGVAPTESQWQLLRAWDLGHAAYRLDTLRIRSAVPDGRRLRLHAMTTNGAQPPELPAVDLERVPPGTYDVAINTRRVTAGALSLRIGPGTPFRVVPLDPLTTQTVRINLPGGADVLGLEPDEALRASGDSVDLVPVRLLRTRGRFARSQVALGPATVAFLDDNAFVEADGFWVKGASQASFVVTSEASASPIVLVVANGAAANRVSIETNGEAEVVEMPPGAIRRVPLPAGPGTHAVTVGASAGFRPVPEGQPGDSRYLGVRVWVE